MRGFLYRDLCAVKNIYKYLGILTAFLALMSFVLKAYYMQFLLPIYGIMMIANQTVSEDEKSGWMVFAAAVPGGRRGMVRSKYRIVLLAAGIFLLLELLLAFLWDMAGKQELVFSLQMSLVCVGLALLMAEISLPLEYSLGYKDGSILSVMIIAAGLFLLSRLRIGLMRGGHDDLLWMNFEAFLPVAAIIGLCPSYQISLRATEHRDF